jgi:hypothetical protein
MNFCRVVSEGYPPPRVSPEIVHELEQLHDIPINLSQILLEREKHELGLGVHLLECLQE